MASMLEDGVKVCLVCSKARPLKIAGKCKHCFCTDCLKTAIGSRGGKVFSCPSCQADCPLPPSGVKGLVYFTGPAVAFEKFGPMLEKVLKTQVANPQYVPKPPKRDSGIGKYVKAVDVPCAICKHQKKDIQALNLCVECKNLYICGNCTELHGKRKATQGHTLIPLQQGGPEQEALCVEHNSPLDSYCTECNQAVCVMCVVLEHGDHTLEKIDDVSDEKLEGLKVLLAKREEELMKMSWLEGQLTQLKRVSPVVDRQDILIKEIEDHAQKCIEKIMKSKEDLKETVKADHQIIRDIPESLEQVSKMVQKMQEPIQRARQLLADTESQPVHRNRLMAVQQDLDALAETADSVQGEGYIDQLQKLHNHDCRFTPAAIESLGKITKTQTRQGDFIPEMIYQGVMFYKIDSSPKFIPCIANLGPRFAVAHPTREGEPSNAVNIYEFPGGLTHTIRDHVPPLYDMAATPDGKLAMLSDGTRRTSRCVKLFDSLTGYISSTRDFDMAKPLSFEVTLEHQYVILGNNKHRERQITVVDKDGQVEHTHVIKEEIDKKRIKPSRITCGGRFTCVIGKLGIVFYEITSTGIHDTTRRFSFADLVDTEDVGISANMWGDISVAFISKNNFLLVNWEKSKEKWDRPVGWNHPVMVPGVERIARVSRRDPYVVTTSGRTIRVFKV